MFSVEQEFLPTVNKHTLNFSIFSTKTINNLNCGWFAGYASVFNIIDSDSDLILPGAFKTINKNLYLLWNHNRDEAIGEIIILREDDVGLYIEANFILTSSIARHAYELLKNGDNNGLSIGYTVDSCIMSKNNIRIIEELTLWEISLVAYPANPKATVLDIKSNNNDSKKIDHILNIAISALKTI